MTEVERNCFDLTCFNKDHTNSECFGKYDPDWTWAKSSWTANGIKSQSLSFGGTKWASGAAARRAAIDAKLDELKDEMTAVMGEHGDMYRLVRCTGECTDNQREYKVNVNEILPDVIVHLGWKRGSVNNTTLGIMLEGPVAREIDFDFAEIESSNKERDDVDDECYLFRPVQDTHNLDSITPQRKQQAAVDIPLTMLRSFRRLGMGQSTKPSIPGMQVVDWQVVEFKSGKGLSVLALKDSKLYVAAYLDDPSQRTDKYTDAPLEPTIVQHPQVIELAHIFPEYTSQFALYCENSQSQREIYIKKRNIVNLFIANGMPALQTPRASQITEHEATICDRLSFHQHPNIAEFLGVQVSNVLDFDSHGMDVRVSLGANRITGLVFTKYDCTLHELITRRQKVNVRLCPQSVWASIQFLHRVGVVHGDIRPHNIFVKRGKDKDQFVVGDFDCAQDVGKVMSLKVGDPKWTKRKAIGKAMAKESDDWSGFIVLKEWLVKETGGKLEDFKEIGRNRPVAR